MIQGARTSEGDARRMRESDEVEARVEVVANEDDVSKVLERNPGKVSRKFHFHYPILPGTGPSGAKLPHTGSVGGARPLRSRNPLDPGNALLRQYRHILLRKTCRAHTTTP